MVHFISSISRVDSKGRVSIPIGLRYKLRLVEGSKVGFQVKDKTIVLIPVDGQIGVKVGTDSVSAKACGASGAGSTPASDPKKR